MQYPGGKGHPCAYTRLISLMPAHDVYIETHAGGANLFERKRPATVSYLVDIDPDVCRTLQERHGRRRNGGDVIVVNDDAVRFLRRFDFKRRRVLTYSDPPYVGVTLRSAPRYRFNYSDEQHHKLLTALRELPGVVMLSGYRCGMYDAALAGWNRIDYDTVTRGRVMVIESCWLNFDPPAAHELHDLRYVGSDRRERWRMTKKRRRWRAMLEKMPDYERAAMLELLLEIGRSSGAGGGVEIAPPSLASGDLAPPAVASRDRSPPSLASRSSTPTAAPVDVGGAR